jgi:hypothetical protein
MPSPVTVSDHADNPRGNPIANNIAAMRRARGVWIRLEFDRKGAEGILGQDAGPNLPGEALPSAAFPRMRHHIPLAERSELILLVEDDDAVRDFNSSMLKR